MKAPKIREERTKEEMLGDVAYNHYLALNEHVDIDMLIPQFLEDYSEGELMAWIINNYNEWSTRPARNINIKKHDGERKYTVKFRDAEGQGPDIKTALYYLIVDGMELDIF